MRAQAPRHRQPPRSRACQLLLRDREEPALIAQKLIEIYVPSTPSRGARRAGRRSLEMLLVQLRGESAILTVGRHHHRARSSEGVGHHVATAGLIAADPAHPALVDAL